MTLALALATGWTPAAVEALDERELATVVELLEERNHRAR